MKTLTRLTTAIGILAVAAGAQAGEHKLTKLWESEAALKVPESVRFDAARKVLYVSNIDGPPWEADGKGSIGKVGLDGKVIAAEWITGLEAPKGMALSDDGKWLYAADMGGVVVIDIDAGKVAKKIAIPDGQQLNDVVNDKGTLYVSDSKGKKVFIVKDGNVSVHLDEKVLKGPNGLLVHKGSLYVLDNNSLNRVEADKSLKVLAARERAGRRLPRVRMGRRGVVRAGLGRQAAAVRWQAHRDAHRRHRLGSKDEDGLRPDVLQEHRDRVQGRMTGS
jgi:sugar lactone lactonase YvrE